MAALRCWTRAKIARRGDLVHVHGQKIFANAQSVAADLCKGGHADKSGTAALVGGVLLVAGLPTAIAVLRAWRGTKSLRVISAYGACRTGRLYANVTRAFDGRGLIGSLGRSPVDWKIARPADRFVLTTRVAERNDRHSQRAKRREAQSSGKQRARVDTYFLAEQRTPSVRLGREQFLGTRS